MPNQADRAKIIAPPPLIGVGCIALAFVARHYRPVPVFQSAGAVQIIVGVALVIASAAIIAASRQQMIASGTHPNPYRPTKAVATGGVYRFSRNPIYIAFLLVVLAFTFFANSFWFVAAAVVLFVVLQFGVVKREERYLAAKFGPSYQAYCANVRRWI